MSKFFELEVRGRRFGYWSKPIVKGKRVSFNGDPTYAWAAEVSDEAGPHIHWCLHLQPAKEPSFRKFLERIRSSIPELAAVPFEELFLIRGLYDYSSYKMYIAKGIDPFYGRAWGFKRVQNQGIVVGKRCGVSANLRRAARKALGL